MLTHEYGTASNIKSRVNRLSVLSAISSAQARLKLYNRGWFLPLCFSHLAPSDVSLCLPVPPNGLVLYVGTILTDEGKEKKVSFDFEPHKPINTFVSFSRACSSHPFRLANLSPLYSTLYRCDNKFQTAALSELLDSDSKFGFIIMDGSGTVSFCRVFSFFV